MRIKAEIKAYKIWGWKNRVDKLGLTNWGLDK